MTSPEAAQPAEGLITRDHLAYDVAPKLLRSEFCSAPWLAASFDVVHTEDQMLYRRRRDFYPPGGNASLMQRCPVCGRMCPPNGARGDPCCDCETEAAHEAFLARLRAPACRDMDADLQRRWWPRRVTYAEFMASPTAGTLFGQEDAAQFVPETEEVEGCAFDFSEWSDGPWAPEDRPRKSTVGDYREALAAALRRLNPRKKEAGRHPGCQIVLLPEPREALLKEIAYHRRTGRIIPSARRVSHPYMPDGCFDVKAACK